MCVSCRVFVVYSLVRLFLALLLRISVLVVVPSTRICGCGGVFGTVTGDVRALPTGLPDGW